MSGIREGRVYWAYQWHATVLSSIGAAILQSQVCEQAVRGALPSSVDELVRLREMLETLEGEARALADAAIRPRGAPLEVAVANTVRAVKESGLPVRLRIRGPVGAVPRRVARGASVVLAEALANALRHATPTSVEVEVTVRDGTLLVRTRDDGVGCEITRFDEGSPKRPRCGIAIMRAQAAALGGRLELSSAPGRGTQVTLFVPLRSPAGARPRRVGRRAPP